MTHVVSALVDSGSAVNIIHHRLVQELQFPVTLCTVSLKIMEVDNQPLGNALITHQTLLLTMQSGLFHVEEISLFINLLHCQSYHTRLSLPTRS